MDLPAPEVPPDKFRLGEQQLRLLADALPVLIAYVDARERLRFVNATYQRWFADGITELVGRSVRDVIGPAGYEVVRPHIRAALSGQTVSYERRIDTAHLGPRYISGTYVPHRTAAGHTVGFYSLATDVTEQRQALAALRSSEDKLRLAVNATDLGLWDYDVVDSVLVWSERLKALYGLGPEDEVTFERFVDGVHPADRARVLGTYQEALQPGQDGRFGFDHRLVTPEGEVRWLQAAGQVIFDARRKPIRVIGTARDVTDQKEAEQELRTSHARTEEILESIDDAFFAVDHQWRFTYINRHCERLWGRDREALLGQVLWDAFPGLPESGPGRAYRAAAAERRPVRIETVAISTQRPIDLNVYPSPSGISVYFRDISDRKAAEQRQQLLMAELDHRVKNTLSAIQSIVAQTAATKHSKDELADSLTGRLSAMGRAHSLLTQSRWEGAGLRQVLIEELGPYDSGDGRRITVAGKDVLLRPKAATAISMVIHELTTNSAKYGALSSSGGQVQVNWTDGNEGGETMLRLEWIERGGPSVAGPGQRGFGSTLIENMLRYEFGGSTRLEFPADGVRCRIETPLERVAVQLATPVRLGQELQPIPHAQGRALAGSRVLVVEDSLLVALDVESTLRSGGVEVVGPATSLTQALDLALQETLDAAILDVNLDGEYVYPVAEVLRARSIPFIFSTGYDSRSTLPEQFRDCPAVQKPFRGEVLLDTLKQALAGAPAP